jgi:hypothetical protein
MSCDLSDPLLKEKFQEIRNNGNTTWMVAGYNDSRDVISLYSSGFGGFEELRNCILPKDEVIYAVIRIQRKLALIVYVHEKISGVKKARVLVHGRAVGTFFKEIDTQISITSKD